MIKFAFAVEFVNGTKLYELIASDKKEARDILWDSLGDRRDYVSCMELIEQAPTDEVPNKYLKLSERVTETTHDKIDEWYIELTKEN